MTAAIETLSALERRITLSIPKATIQSEVDARLKRLARTVKADGFRPGKVPLKVVAQRYGFSVEYEVMQDKVGNAFVSAASQAQLRVAGAPKFDQKTDGVADDQLAFEAVFEVYPDVAIGDLSAVEVERVTTEVSEAAVDKTLEILRKQRRHFHVRGEAAHDGATAEGVAAADGDRVTVDFEGKLDGVAFAGGSATDFEFILGDGRMLPEFEAATLGLQAAQSKTFDLKFPDDYHGKDVAGKTAQFTITLKKVEWPHLPAVDAEFAKSLGIADGDLAKLREDIRNNLQREVKFRLVARNKQAALEALSRTAQLEVPKALVSDEVQRLQESARADLKQRGVKDADTAPLPEELFRPQAEQRVRLGLAVAELVKQHKLEATPEQIRAHVDELAQSYEKPADVVTWYYGKRERLAEVEAAVVEKNVTDFIFSKVKVVEKNLPFDDVMAA
ncbi:MAG: trigger factor [Betaproteobacteria bacterium]|nr:trigger factor [Betaproteobacteria bacterium]